MLYELGYASAISGWDRIIMVQNVSFGSIEQLPFDLRGRRILQYQLDEDTGAKAEQKMELKLKMVNTFSDAFAYYRENGAKLKEK